MISKGIQASESKTTKIAQQGKKKTLLYAGDTKKTQKKINKIKQKIAPFSLSGTIQASGSLKIPNWFGKVLFTLFCKLESLVWGFKLFRQFHLRKGCKLLYLFKSFWDSRTSHNFYFWENCSFTALRKCLQKSRSINWSLDHKKWRLRWCIPWLQCN